MQQKAQPSRSTAATIILLLRLALSSTVVKSEDKYLTGLHLGTRLILDGRNMHNAMSASNFYVHFTL
jgi:hypothetical protein